MIVIDKIKVAYIHMHTLYSEKDGLADIPDYPKRAIELNKASSKYEIIGIWDTPHGHLYSMTKMYKECKDKGFINSAGFEAYHVDDLTITDDKRYHMVLIACNDAGKKNLFSLATLAGFNKTYGKTRINEAMMKQYGKGIIATSACLAGKLPKLIVDGKYEEAKAKALEYQSFFEDFYLEVQPHEIPDQLIVNEALVKMSKETGIPLVITCDSHYVLKEDKKYHDILKRIDVPDGSLVYTVDAYMNSFEELEEYCIKYNIPLTALSNTGIIAEKCKDFKLEPSNPKGFMPTFPCPEGYTEEIYLREIAKDGLIKKLITKKFPDAMYRFSRLEEELEVICAGGYAGYFLILWDWIRWCRANNIPIGPGRGSAASSLVCYTLGITNVDPVANKFIFARFLTMERLEMPDLYKVERYGNIAC